MRVTGVTANLPVADIDAARGFYADYLGLNVEGMNLGWSRATGRQTGERPPARDPTPQPQDSVTQ